jgi:hypothetical protein
VSIQRTYASKLVESILTGVEPADVVGGVLLEKAAPGAEPSLDKGFPEPRGWRIRESDETEVWYRKLHPQWKQLKLAEERRIVIDWHIEVEEVEDQPEYDKVIAGSYKVKILWTEELGNFGMSPSKGKSPRGDKLLVIEKKYSAKDFSVAEAQLKQLFKKLVAIKDSEINKVVKRS